MALQETLKTIETLKSTLIKEFDSDLALKVEESTKRESVRTKNGIDSGLKILENVRIITEVPPGIGIKIDDQPKYLADNARKAANVLAAIEFYRVNPSGDIASSGLDCQNDPEILKLIARSSLIFEKFSQAKPQRWPLSCGVRKMAQEVRISGQHASEAPRYGIGIINKEGRWVDGPGDTTMPDPGPGFPAPYATDPDVSGSIPIPQTDWNSIVNILIRNPQGSPYPAGQFKQIKISIAYALRYKSG